MRTRSKVTPRNNNDKAKQEQHQDHRLINYLKRDPLEIQYPKFENSRLGFIESVNER